MKILSSAQIREWDAYTIENEPVSSWGLMERASRACFQWLLCKFDQGHTFSVFCGKGNNGGDGLAVARMLSQKGHPVRVYVIEHREAGSADFEENLRLLNKFLIPVHITSPAEITVPETGVVIDALLGSGLSKPAGGLLARAIEAINESGLTVVSVDIASGLFADKMNAAGDVIVKPGYTVSFQVPKPCFMILECGPYVGEWQVLDIGLSADYCENLPRTWQLTTRENLPHLLKKRGKFSHKGTYGHAFMIAGSYGKMGAAILASRACMRSGVGLLSVYVPGCGYEIMQISVPEAMVQTDAGAHFVTSIPDLSGYQAVGIGPGIGTEKQTADAFRLFLQGFRGKLVVDADAINILALHQDLLKLLPEKTVLTPHPKEFRRLAGDFENGFEAIAKAQKFASQHQLIICLKGAHTAVIFPDGSVYFNTTGNPGMATGGSGDVLTGIILALLAQGYEPDVATRLAVYKHGEAGDRGVLLRSETALVASDIIENLR